MSFGRVFHDDFESGNADKWQMEYEKAVIVQTAKDGGSPHSGSHMAEGNWNGLPGQETRSGLYLPSWEYTNEFLVRFWLRYDQDVDKVGGNKVVRIAGTYPNHSFYCAAAMEKPNGVLFAYWESIGGVAGPILYDGPPAGDCQWHRYDVYTKHHSPGQEDGIVRLFLDGQVVLEGVNIKSYAEGFKWGEFVFMSNWSSNPGWEHDGENHAYLDDVEIFSDAGTGGTGSMADGTAQAGADVITEPPPDGGKPDKPPKEDKPPNPNKPPK
jgi:hypothetical protein